MKFTCFHPWHLFNVQTVFQEAILNSLHVVHMRYTCTRKFTTIYRKLELPPILIFILHFFYLDWSIDQLIYILNICLYMQYLHMWFYYKQKLLTLENIKQTRRRKLYICVSSKIALMVNIVIQLGSVSFHYPLMILERYGIMWILFNHVLLTSLERGGWLNYILSFHSYLFLFS
jgi:hypothetical protein